MRFIFQAFQLGHSHGDPGWKRQRESGEEVAPAMGWRHRADILQDEWSDMIRPIETRFAFYIC